MEKDQICVDWTKSIIAFFGNKKKLKEILGITEIKSNKIIENEYRLFWTTFVKHILFANFGSPKVCSQSACLARVTSIRARPTPTRFIPFSLASPFPLSFTDSQRRFYKGDARRSREPHEPSRGTASTSAPCHPPPATRVWTNTLALDGDDAPTLILAHPRAAPRSARPRVSSTRTILASEQRERELFD